MGIKGLTKLLHENAKGAIREQPIKSFFGRKVAVDASMCLYQFLIAVRSSGPGGGQLTNADGEVTSHLIGLLYRTIRMMENGIKPVYVFDGKPPDMKGGELEKRKEKREKAAVELKEAEEQEDHAKVEQMQRRLVRVSRQQNEEAQQLLTHMGVPWVQAPGEAEAQCAAMCRAGVVYGTATEDMDALTFGTPRLIRHLTYSEARKMPPVEFNLDIILQQMGLSMDAFIDICILCGCDYVPHIRGIGPKKSVQLIRKHKSIEGMLKALDRKRHPVPEDFLFEQARELFKHPLVDDCSTMQLEWKDPDEAGLEAFLVDDKGFNIDRLRSSVLRLKKCKGKGAQKRMDSFFKVLPSPSVLGKKRKLGATRGKGKSKGKPAGKKARTKK